MSDRSKPAVLRDVALTAQSRSLPGRRPTAEPKPVAPRGMPVFSGAMPMAVPGPAKEDARAKALADELQAAREQGLREGLAEAQRRLDEARRAAAHQLQQQEEALKAAWQAEHDATTGRLQQLLEGLAPAVAQRLSALEADAIELAFSAVCRVMGEAHASRSTVSALVQQAMAQLRGTPPVRVRLHPDDLAALQGDALVARHPAVQWVADASVTAGGCLLDTAHGTLDARLDQQLARLARLWVAAVPSPAAGG